jgi:phenylacetate-CoA ligase
MVGEIVLTGGLNECLPLVRYATGDFASLDLQNGSMPALRNLHGRPPVWFRDSQGQWFASIDVSTALAILPISSLAVHQAADGSISLRCAGDGLAIEKARAALAKLFRYAESSISQSPADQQSKKCLTYTSDLPPPAL